MSRTIIIPLSDPDRDHEGIAERAISCARMLADGEETRLILASAVADDMSLARRRAYLEHIAGTIGEDVRIVVEYGDPETVILDLAAETTDPIVVMASHGRRGVELRVLGSIAGAVAGNAPCPVLILPASAQSEAPICTRVERVLLPINDPLIADALVDATVAVLGTERAQQIEFRLIEVTAPIPPQPQVCAGERYQGAHEVPAHFLRRIAERMRGRGLRVTWDLRVGDPACEIARIAAEDAVDLIVLPAYSRHGFNSVLQGVLAQQAGMTRPVPVLLVRPELTLARAARTRSAAGEGVSSPWLTHTATA